MKRVLWSLLALVFLLLCLAWRAPAWVLLDQLDGQVPGLALGSSEGQLWRGRLDQVNYDGLALEGVSWRLQPVKALTGRPLAVAVDAPLRLQAQLGLPKGQELKLYDVEVAGKIAELLEAVALPSMGFDGDYRATMSAAVVSQQGCSEFAGNLYLNRLSGDIDGLSQLGAVQAEVSCQNRGLRIVIDDDNPMRVRGTVNLWFNGRASGQVTLSPPSGSALYDSLSQFLGRPSNGQDFQLRL